HCSVYYRDLHRFPTRRSSDLGGSMPISASVSGSAQSSTTTAMLAIFALNFFGRPRSARSTNASNSRRVMTAAEQRRTWLLPRLRSEEHTSELQSLRHLVCRLL